MVTLTIAFAICTMVTDHSQVRMPGDHRSHNRSEAFAPRWSVNANSPHSILHSLHACIVPCSSGLLSHSIVCHAHHSRALSSSCYSCTSGPQAKHPMHVTVLLFVEKHQNKLSNAEKM